MRWTNRIYELEGKQSQVLELLSTSPDFERLPRMIEGIVGECRADGFINLVNDLMQKRLTGALEEAFNQLLSLPFINISLEYENGILCCSVSGEMIRREVESKWSGMKGTQ